MTYDDEKDSVIANYSSNVWTYEGIAWYTFETRVDFDLPYGRWAREPLTSGRLFHSGQS
jgi:hypothetical protein